MSAPSCFSALKRPASSPIVIPVRIGIGWYATNVSASASAGVPSPTADRVGFGRSDGVEGPPADADALTFVAYHPIPIRTGMTIGELAGLFNAEKQLGADITVVKMAGYSRDLWYDETGLPWVNPSPNLRSVTEAALYPGIGLLETTNVSVGRGTDAPFEQFGAPWMLSLIHI